MFEKTEVRYTRHPIDVTVRLANAEEWHGRLFVLKGQRLSDLLNDDRRFLPLETAAGELILLAKAQIANLVALVTDAEPEADDADPYTILRCEPTATDSEVRGAWMKRLKACHPDRIVALDLDPEIVRAARRASQRLNAAYDTIVRQRKADRSRGAAA